jgi:hypothetical protein
MIVRQLWCASLQRCRVGDPAATETLSREHSDFDPGLIQPTPVSRSIVHREPVPDFVANLATEQIGEGFAAMDESVLILSRPSIII